VGHFLCLWVTTRTSGKPDNVISYGRGNAWKWPFAFLNIGMIGMVGGLLISGMAQAFYERAVGGSTLEAFMAGQANPWFVQGMYARLGFGILFAVGFLILVYDIIRMGRKGSPPARVEAA
jgi:nitric oxide reductase subunit B